MDNCCRICKLIFRNDTELHRHLRSHKLTMMEYYYLYFPRKDLLTGDMIEFKDRDFYFATDFNSKANLITWLGKQSPETVVRYCTDLLKSRIKKKNLVYSPSQVELRTLMSPSILFYKRVFGDYYKLCESLGLKNKYKNFAGGGFFKTQTPVELTGKIIVDTREQLEFVFKSPTKSEKLDYGDYRLESEPKFVVERKSLQDFIATLSNGYVRFKNEVERAAKDGAYLLVVVERSLNDCLSFQFLTDVNIKWRITPEFVFHNVRELIQGFPNLQFLFTRSKSVAAELTESLLLFGRGCFDYDLQLLYDERFLI